VIVPVGKDTKYMLIAQRLGGTNFVGVALLALPATLLESFWAPQNLGKDSTIAVNREDGAMVGRYPTLAGPQSATNSPMWATIKATPNGAYTMKSPIDGKQIRAIASSGSRRSPMQPNVPTLRWRQP